MGTHLGSSYLLFEYLDPSGLGYLSAFFMRVALARLNLYNTFPTRDLTDGRTYLRSIMA